MNQIFLSIWIERSKVIDRLLNCAAFSKKKDYQIVSVIFPLLFSVPTVYLIGMQLINVLTDALIRWTLGSELTSIPIEHNMQEMIALGVGFLDAIPTTLKDDVTLPVYISEPLVVLSLRSIFETQRWTTMQAQMTRSFCTTLNSPTLGYVLEMVLPLVLMNTFGGKYSPLEEAIVCGDKSLGLRRVTLVSLKRVASGELQTCPVSWNEGSSDCLGFKAKTPAHVLEFFDNPDGKVFLFPDNHMHPHLSWFLQDEDTMELIVCFGQSKLSLKAKAWKNAMEALTPQFFYTMVVGIILCNSCFYP